VTGCFTEKQKREIRTYYFQQAPRDGISAMGEPLSDFDLFAEPPRVGARDAIERWMDLPEIIQMEMSSMENLGVIIAR